MNRSFSPSWLMTIITLSAVVVFIMLGMWQLDRAAYKQQVKGTFESRLGGAYQYFSAGDSMADIDYQNLILEGEFDTTRTILVDNKIFQGQAGYEVLTPFVLAGSQKTVLVNRGWVALGNSREFLPIIEKPKVLDKVKGIATVPNTDGFRMGKVSLGNDWPQVVPFIDIDVMQVAFSGQLLPLVLWLAPEHPGFYQRSWNPVWADPEKSKAYAIQWFIFAVIAVVLYLGLNLREVK